MGICHLMILFLKNYASYLMLRLKINEFCHRCTFNLLSRGEGNEREFKIVQCLIIQKQENLRRVVCYSCAKKCVHYIRFWERKRGGSFKAVVKRKSANGFCYYYDISLSKMCAEKKACVYAPHMRPADFSEIRNKSIRTTNEKGR